MTAALVKDGTVVLQTWDAIPNPIIMPDGTAIHCASIGWANGAFSILPASYIDTPPSGPASVVSSSAAVVSGAVQITRVWSAPSQAHLIAYAYEKHEAISGGGVFINGVAVSTTAQGLVNLAGAVQLAQLNSGQIFNWVQNSGTATLNSGQVIALGESVGAWVQSSFTTLGRVIAAVNAGTITSYAQVDSPPSPIPAWPVNS